MTVKFLDIEKRRCAGDVTCLANFYAECCCAADAEVCEGRDPHVKCRCCSYGEGPKTQAPVADLICMCKRRLYAVEVTERGDLWGYKNDLEPKIKNVKSIYQHVENIVFIISNSMKYDRRSLTYFKRTVKIDVRVMRPGVNICAGVR